MKPAKGTPILSASVEAEGRATDLCTGDAAREVLRARLLAWLAEGAREVTAVLCWLPQQRWAEAPPRSLGDTSVREHIRNLAVRQSELLVSVSEATAEGAECMATSGDSPEALVETIGATRFELLRRLEQAPDDVWAALEWSLLDTRQHELQQLAVIWKIALNWDRASRSAVPALPLHPADRLEESH